MIYLSLFLSFFKIGLFAVGGGLATIPFLRDLSVTTNWFSGEELINMIAISESTPGPIGINMATFAGLKTAGLFGGIIATFGLVLPAFLIIIWMSKALQKWKNSDFVQTLFDGLRPTVAGLIAAFTISVSILIFKNTAQPALSAFLLICYTVLVFQYKWHPILFILLSAALGILIGL